MGARHALSSMDFGEVVMDGWMDGLRDSLVDAV